MSDRELEEALRDLGGHLDHPATPPLAERVRARLEEAPERPAAPGLRVLPGRPRARRLVLAGLAAALLAAAVLVLSPTTRDAVADLLGLRGIKIQLGGPPTSATSSPATSELGGLGGQLGLGHRTTLGRARASVKFPVLVPTEAGFEHPDAVYADPDQPADGRVDLVYRARPGLPASPYTEAGLLITEFRANVDEGFMKKLSGGGEVQFLTVAGGPGYWLPQPHGLAYVDRDGSFQDERSRLAGSTLIWQRGDVTFRLEGRVSREQAVRIAESMR
ncbi:MAG TPA: hypothetical protein VF486_09690 [Actinomycetes bacterium]